MGLRRHGCDGSVPSVDRQARAGRREAPRAGDGLVALYVHIPYCLAKCPYCDFNSYAASTWPEHEYAAALERELETRAAEEPLRSATIGTVFFGGGTPSLLAPRTIGALLEAVARVRPIADGAEITLEANPGTVDAARLAGFRAAGVSRLSLGVQSFQPPTLEALGRRHSVDDSRAALRDARRAGFADLSLDLIHAVPGQDLRSCEADLDAAVAVAPEHVSTYALTYESGTAMHRDLRAGGLRRAPEELEVAMFHTVRERLGRAGFEHYEISNHARPGHAARHNLAYWRGVPYVGLGAGAHSYSPGAHPWYRGPATTMRPCRSAGGADPGSGPSPGESYGTRWENLRDPNGYMASVLASGQAVASHESLTRAQAMGEACWLGLRELAGVDPEAFAARFGESLLAAFPHVEDLLGEGLLERHGSRIALAERGLLLADSVFASFL